MENDYLIMNGELYHHGIMGMKWGVRRYQNEDGSYTSAGKARYNVGTGVTNFRRGMAAERNDPRTVREREAYQKMQKSAREAMKADSSRRRSASNSDGKTTFKQRDAQRVYNRIHKIRSNEKRMDKMTANQLRSLDRAEKYWKQRAEGKQTTTRRGIIRRQADRYRSYSALQRTGITAALNILSSIGGIAYTARLGGDVGQTAIANGKAVVKQTAINMALYELAFSKLLGHF